LPAEIVRYATPVNDPVSLRADYDVVIGADGINSAVRQAVFGDEAEPRYSGVIGWRGTVALDIEAGGETWGRGIKFGLTPQEPGRTNWYAVLDAAEDYRPPAGDLVELRRLFGNWHHPIPRVLDLIEADTVLRHGLHYLAPLPSFTTDNVALLGDAAHAMTPDLGQGALPGNDRCGRAHRRADQYREHRHRPSAVRPPPAANHPAHGGHVTAGQQTRSDEAVPARA
jgi:2-polyprenyl-6-methoxyphenol hydroxylase-like FAD-dependent oxidoreductase